MVKILKKSLFLALAVVASVILYNRYGSPVPSIVVSDTVTVTKVFTDTITIQNTTYVPKFVYRDTGIIVYTDAVIDTDFIISSYFQKVGVIDTLTNDSMAFIIIVDTLFMNRIYSRTPFITLYPKHCYSTQFVTINKPDRATKIYAGIFIGGNKDGFSFGPAVNYLPRKQYSFGMSYNIMHKEIYFSLMCNPFKHP
ncbi:MAG: hypothetical protein H8E34_04045 [Bacteroidetes bacterium]|nr:hypothetical protein [Bacteroidota bacterium]MBL6943206.1 hypothetical protein [Bacteroidales bacterium]